MNECKTLPMMTSGSSDHISMTSKKSNLTTQAVDGKMPRSRQISRITRMKVANGFG